MEKKLRIHNKDEWEYFADAYLELAVIGFEKVQKLNSENFIDKFLIIPSLFNFKHGIEIMLKTLSIRFLNKSHLDRSDLTHDIHEIFVQFKARVKKEEVEKAAAEFIRKNPDVPSEDVSYGNMFQGLEELVVKYITLDIIKSKIKSSDLTFEDHDNTALRYPSNTLNVQLNYKEVVERITKAEILEMRVDCHKAKELLWKFLVIELNKDKGEQK